MGLGSRNAMLLMQVYTAATATLSLRTPYARAKK